MAVPCTLPWSCTGDGRGGEASLCYGDVWVKIEGRRSGGERALETGALSVGWEREVRWVG